MRMVDRPRFELAISSTLDVRKVRRNCEMLLGANRLEEATYGSAIELELNFGCDWGALGQVHVELGDLNEVE